MGAISKFYQLATHGMNITYLIGKPRRKLLIIDGRLIDSAGAVHGSASHMIMLSIPALADFSKVSVPSPP